MNLLLKCQEDNKIVTEYFSTSPVKTSENFALLGFKDNLPVINETTTMEETLNTINKIKNKVVMVMVDPQSGEKYLNINGKKLKMVQEPHLLQTDSENVPKSTSTPPKKTCILGQTPQSKPTSAASKPTQISTVNSSTASSHSVNYTLSKDKEFVNKTAACSTDTLSSVKPSVTKVTILNGKGLNESLKCVNENQNRTQHINRSMESIDLSKKFKINVAKRTCDMGVQTAPKLVDASVQTEDEAVSGLDTNVDLLEFIESDFPKRDPVVNPITKEQKMFHNDLKSCLIPNVDGNLPIHEGVLKNDVMLVKRMCAVLKARQQTIDVENHNNYTPFQLALLTEASIDIFRILLSYKPRLDTCDDEGNNIIHLAVKYQREYILNDILNYGKSINFNMNYTNFDGLTPLMVCCVNGLYECANILIKYLDVDGINIKDQKSGRTALFHAAERHDVDMVKLLLDHKADTKIKNFFGTSPHDAMYELDDVPKDIRNLIFCKKRKMDEEFKAREAKKQQQAQMKSDFKNKNLRMYSRLQKITTPAKKIPRLPIKQEASAVYFSETA